MAYLSKPETYAFYNKFALAPYLLFTAGLAVVDVFPHESVVP